jgi:hypothetical protein
LASFCCGAFAASPEPTGEVAVVYLALAFVVGAVTASMQGFGVGSLHWIEAAVGGPVLGLGFGLLTRLVKRTNLPGWLLAGSLLTLALTVAGARCAMCFFVGR